MWRWVGRWGLRAATSHTTGPVAATALVRHLAFSVTGAQVNYLIEGLDVEGELVISGNVSTTPRPTDWQGDQACTWDGITDSWGTIELVAHDPMIEGWID
jgi:hypothetical protein